MNLTNFISNNWLTILFYLIIVYLLVKYRRKLEVQGIVLLYKTKIGIKLMDRIARKHNKTVKILGTIGIFIGFIGMGVILFFIFQSLYNLILRPELPPAMSLVIPGVKIPGSPIFVPFGYGILALFIVILVHEFSHGVVCKAYKIRVKSSGVGLFAILPLAFVEPDEKALSKAKWKAQNAMYAAGPWSNVLLAVLFLILMIFVAQPLMISETQLVDDGYYFFSVNGTPAYESGIGSEGFINANVIPTNLVMVIDHDIIRKTNNPGKFIDTINNVSFGENYSLFVEELLKHKPGDIIVLSGNNEEFEIVAENRSNIPYLGVNAAYRELKENHKPFKFGFAKVLFELFFWIQTLSLGIGLANLLPLGPVDGGRMIHSTFERWFGKKGIKLWAIISWIVLAVILIVILVPMIKALI